MPVGSRFEVRKIGLHDLRVALAMGWDDFLAMRGDLVFIGLIYPVAILLAGIYAYHASVLPLMFPMAAGSILFGPIVASGFYELARRRELGLDFRWRHFLDPFHNPVAHSVISLTCIVVIMFILWLMAAWYIYSATLGVSAPEAINSASEFLRAVLTTSEGQWMMAIGNLVGMGFAIVVLAISVVSFPMLVDRRISWITAMQVSVRVTWSNPGPILVWGLIVVVLLLLGSLPALVGLAVVLPVLGYATWHLYTRAVVRWSLPGAVMSGCAKLPDVRTEIDEA